MRWMPAVLLALAGCYTKPVWFEYCDCGDNLCVQDGNTFECKLVPETCSAAYYGECDPSLLDRDCAADLCGEFVGEWDFMLDCRSRGSRTFRYADCTSVGTGPAADTGG